MTNLKFIFEFMKGITINTLQTIIENCAVQGKTQNLYLQKKWKKILNFYPHYYSVSVSKSIYLIFYIYLIDNIISIYLYIFVYPSPIHSTSIIFLLSIYRWYIYVSINSPVSVKSIPATRMIYSCLICDEKKRK